MAPPVFLIDLFRLCLWLAILAIIFVPLERFFAVHPSKIWRKQTGIDLGYYFLGGLILGPLLSLPLGLLAWAAHVVTPSAIQTMLSGLPLWARIALAMIAGDAGYYWGHRLMHRMPVLWRFHAIHHSAEQVDFLVNTRAHPLDLVFGRLSGAIPIYALGLAAPTGAADALITTVVMLAGTIWGFLIHANLRWRFGPLAHVLVTPAFHHWHHAWHPADRNFASLLPVFDRLFGTFHLPRAAWPSRYGIKDAMPETLGGQLIQPLLGSVPGARSSEVESTSEVNRPRQSEI